MFEPAHIRAHKHSSKNCDEIVKSEICGCFYCLATFPPGEVTRWIDGDRTAICPKCDIDSVIGSASGFPIDAVFLKKMDSHWFSTTRKPESRKG
jgi:hypothetical protein